MSRYSIHTSCGIKVIQHRVIGASAVFTNTLYEFEICFTTLIITSMITPNTKYINEVAVNLIILGQVIRICADRFWRVGESNDKV